MTIQKRRLLIRQRVFEHSDGPEHDDDGPVFTPPPSSSSLFESPPAPPTKVATGSRTDTSTPTSVVRTPSPVGIPLPNFEPPTTPRTLSESQTSGGAPQVSVLRIHSSAVGSSALTSDPTPTSKRPMFTTTLSGFVFSNGTSQQEISHTPQDTGTPTPSAVPPKPGSSPATPSRMNRAAFIAPICIGALALLFLSGVLYFRVTRKRWPFTGHRRQILEPFRTERVKQAVAATRNQPLGSGLGKGSSGESAGRTQHGYPLISNQHTPSSEVPISEQVENQSALTTLMREVENIKQVLSMGTQSTAQHTDQSQNDEPPDYASQPEFAGARPPGITRGEMRNS